MGWVFHQLGGDPRPLFDANIFHPEPLTLTYSDSMLLPSLMARAVAGGRPAPGGCLQRAVPVGVLAVGAHHLPADRPLTGSARAAFIGGLLYGFYPYRFEHYSHLELQMTYWMPLALLAHPPLRASRCGPLRRRAAVCAAWRSSIRRCTTACSFRSMRRHSRHAAARGRDRVAPRWWCRSRSLPRRSRWCWRSRWLDPTFAAQAMKGERDVADRDVLQCRRRRTISARIRAARVYGGRLLADEYPERALFPGVGAPRAVGGRRWCRRSVSTRLAYLAGLVFAFDLSRGLQRGASTAISTSGSRRSAGMRVPARVSVILGNQPGRARRVRGASHPRAVARRDGPASLAFAALVAVRGGRPAPGAAAAAGVAGAAADLRRASPADSTAVLAEFPVHRGRAGRRPTACRTCISRCGTGGRWSTATADSRPRPTRQLKKTVARFPGPDGAGHAARARRQPRERQLRVLPDRV